MNKLYLRVNLCVVKHIDCWKYNLTIEFIFFCTEETKLKISIILSRIKLLTRFFQ